MRRIVPAVILVAVFCPAALLWTVLGCSGPATSYLPEGSRAIVSPSVDSDGHRASDVLMISDDRRQQVMIVDEGTELMVLDDPKTEQDDPGQRKVRVKITEGQYKGAIGKLKRSQIKPIR